MSDENSIKNLRRDLEGWREVIVGLHSLLTWEKQYFPAITAAVISFSFLFVWYMDLAILTLISLICIILTIADFAVPKVIPKIFGQDKWTGNQERKYEEVITDLVRLKECCCQCASKIQSVKATCPKMFFALTVMSLLSLAWLGNIFNNFFLAYLVVLFAALHPGLRKNELYNKYMGMVCSNVSGILRKFCNNGSEETKKKE